jgi:hypothetical protein
MATAVRSQVCWLLRFGSDANEDTAKLGFSHVALDTVDPDSAVASHLVADALVIEVGRLEAAADGGVVPVDLATFAADRLGVARVTAKSSAEASAVIASSISCTSRLPVPST